MENITQFHAAAVNGEKQVLSRLIAGKMIMIFIMIFVCVYNTDSEKLMFCIALVA